ncbi:hypothetical protein KL933_001441 [Ogataea haglerorum]|uniref:Oxysterol-binding protein n=1 Tax=Ogataea haglerorum TaxID=1937702 RepID=A0AAN6D7P2_9ASCO|nr:hypothetical protein KL933_001441 [Ogataea haglerorum]KAG7732205.1 hypothetical protein KL948_002403 [Ogataea haglerorum]
MKLCHKDKHHEKKVSDDVEDIDEVDDQGQSILMGIISQLRPGSDLSRITLPTFILERKSMLERITNQLQQPDILLAAHSATDPVERFVTVVKWYMSCWHIAPKAVKKPLNPILGEYFTCYWDLPDGSQAYYVAEQTSHHPPKSSYFYIIPDYNIRVDGMVVPKSKFLGNSTAAIMEGVTKLSFLDIVDEESGECEYYTMTQPNMYARGILFGTLKFELGDHLILQCPRTNLLADIDFKTKGFISGSYNVIEGQIKNTKTSEVLYELSGKWTEAMYIKDIKTGKKSVFFDCEHSSPLKPKVRDISEQGPYESRRLWKKVTDALAQRDHHTATDEKFKIEEEQRVQQKKREEEGVDFHPKLFKQMPVAETARHGNENLEYVIYKDKVLNKDLKAHKAEDLRKHIFEIAPFLPGQKFHPEFEIPAYKKS